MPNFKFAKSNLVFKVSPTYWHAMTKKEPRVLESKGQAETLAVIVLPAE